MWEMKTMFTALWNMVLTISNVSMAATATLEELVILNWSQLIQQKGNIFAMKFKNVYLWQASPCIKTEHEMFY